MKTTVLNPKICKLIEERLLDEMTAFYTYLSIANWCKSIGFMKAGDYFAKESDDELGHAKMLTEFLVGWNDIPDLPVIAKPKLEFKSLLEAIETAYKIELSLLEKYNETCETIEDMDLSVYQFLTKFLEIQTSSVAEYSDKLNLLENCKTDDKFQMLMLEEQLFT
mgnify:CR=1 FL=1